MSNINSVMDFLNYAPAAERNAQAIAAQLALLLDSNSRVLEIGSGSGQHAVCFVRQLQGVVWQGSEMFEGLAALQHNLSDYLCEQLLVPVELDVCNGQHWQNPAPCNTVFTANTLHIMSWNAVEAFFRGVGVVLPTAGRLIAYGPFRYSGEYTADSNREFDGWLQARDPDSGLRDIVHLQALAASQGLVLDQDIAMPANNQLLVWRKRTA